MALPLCIMTWEEIEELVSRNVKEQKERFMPRLRDKMSNPFTIEILVVTVSSHVQSPRIDCYQGEGDPVEYIQRHEVSLLGMTNDDNHFALLFPSTIGGIASHWFFGLPKASIK